MTHPLLECSERDTGGGHPRPTRMSEIVEAHRAQAGLGCLPVITVGTLGATGITAATLAGQLAASAVLDKAGVLVLVEREITLGRVAEIALLAAGTYLIVR